MNTYRHYQNDLSKLNENLTKASSNESSTHYIDRPSDVPSGRATSGALLPRNGGLHSPNNNEAPGVSLIQTAEGALQDVHVMINRMAELVQDASAGNSGGKDAAVKTLNTLKPSIPNTGNSFEDVTPEQDGQDPDSGTIPGGSSDPNLLVWTEETGWRGVYDDDAAPDDISPCGKHPAGAEGDHSTKAACGVHYVCEHGDNTNCPVDDTTGIFITHSDDGSVIAGFQYSDGVMVLVGEKDPVDNGEDDIDQGSTPNWNYSQFATNGGNIYGSSDPEVVMVTPNGDMAVGGPGSATVEQFSEQGDFLNGWDVESDGEELRFASRLKVSLGGKTTTSITMQRGDIAQLDVMKVEGEVIGYNNKNSAEDIIDDMIKTPTKIVPPQTSVSGAKSNLGTSANQLPRTIDNLLPTGENIPSTEPRIQDVNGAVGMTNYPKNNVLLLSAQAMLAKASEGRQNVLGLLL